MNATTLLRLQPAGFELPAAKTALNRLLQLKPSFSLDHAFSPQRPALEAYIGQQFASAYGATITEFLPVLSSMCCQGRISAVAGIRTARKNDLFIEQYLDEPIETMLSRLCQTSVNRPHIVEIGNLSATHRGATLLFFITQIAMLYEAGFQWGVFTATAQVKNIIGKLNFMTLDLGPADPTQLEHRATGWGNYYDSRPTVLAVNITMTMASLRQSPLPAAVIVLFESTIIEFSRSMRTLTCGMSPVE